MKWRPGSMEWLILGVALALRLWALDLRPPHFDEGINGWFVDQMTRRGFYQYDPTNFHGPLHFYVLWFFQTLFGRDLWVLRMPTVIFGIATVLLMLRFERFTSRTAVRWAAWFTAISPAFVYYSRYAIHEPALVVACQLMLLGFLGLLSYRAPHHGLPDRGLRDFVFLCTGATLAILTKETWVIHLVAFALAFPCLLIWEFNHPSSPPVRAPFPSLPLGGVLRCACLCLFAFVLFYSGNFFHWPGLLGPIETYSNWVARGSEGDGHDKPWHYWLMLGARYEWAFLAGLVAAALQLRRSPWTTRYIAIAASGVLLAYTLIRYKTPWCIISLEWPFLILAGVLCTAPAFGGKPGAVLGLILTGWSLAQCVRINWVSYADDSEPFSYVATYPEIRAFTEPLVKAAERDPRILHQPGRIILTDHYPLPWMLGEFSAIGYYKPEKSQPSGDVGVLAVQQSDQSKTEKLLNGSYYVVPFRMRSGQEDAVAYFLADTFGPEFPDRVPEGFPR